MASECLWKWNDRFECWQTTCGGELTDSDVDELVNDYSATHCIWCGGEIELDDSDAGSARREEEAGLRRDYYESVRPKW